MTNNWNNCLWGIVGREKNSNQRFKSLDYQEGVFVDLIFYQTLWDNKEHVDSLVVDLNKDNPNYEFKTIKRG